jgi:hypothetical protein
MRKQLQMGGTMSRPAGEGSEAPGLDKLFRPGAPELAFPTTLAGAWPAPGISAGSGFQAPVRLSTALGASADATHPVSLDRQKLQHVQALDSVIDSLTKRCQAAWRSMRSRASAPRPTSILGRAESQDRMDLITRVAGWCKDFVNPLAVDQVDLKPAPSRSKG